MRAPMVVDRVVMQPPPHPVGIIHFARLPRGRRKEQGADVLTELMWDESAGAILVGGFEWHGMSSRAQRQTLFIKAAVNGFALVGEGHGGKPTCLVEVIVDVEGIKPGYPLPDLADCLAWNVDTIRRTSSSRIFNRKGSGYL